jgi:hypothetical protein
MNRKFRVIWEFGDRLGERRREPRYGGKLRLDQSVERSEDEYGRVVLK